MRLRIAVATVLMLVLASCADESPVTADSPGPSPPPSPTAGRGPISLIGLWTVADTGEEPGTVLRIAPNRDLSLWRTCGTLFGAWAGSQDAFIGDVSGGSSKCFPTEGRPSDSTPSWLRTATGYRSFADGSLELVDRSEEPVARLLPGGKPKVGPDVAASEAEPPVITDQDRAELTRTTALPTTLTRVEPRMIVGRWVPVKDGGEAFVEFRGDGTWAGSDGCNGNGGRWIVTSQSMLATSRASTMIGCDGPRVAAWLSRTAMAGFANEALVLLDAAGTEVGRLKKN
ncbi:META domain-containing protein [Cryptosporangium minutisporangium]|uniref:DUF306 domain-containing protein n=1 Tax=Cryptosporangium minutisporangium TaxID=113569 RepID=A0ABP6T5W5_9ACTN